MKNLIFLLLFSAPMFSQTVYKTVAGEKYHKAECRIVKANKSSSMTFREAIKSGLEPCDICKPVRRANVNASSTGKAASAKVATVQCKAYLNTKQRCKHMTASKTGYCFQHKVK